MDSEEGKVGLGQGCPDNLSPAVLTTRHSGEPSHRQIFDTANVQ